MHLFFFLVLFSTLLGATIRIGEETLSVEIADTPELQAKGLMYRNDLLDGQGMLFVYKKAQRLSFWMKNTWIPLSIAFFDEKKQIINILDMNEIRNTSIHYQSLRPALYALEVPLGWFQKHNIEPGAKFSFID